VLRWKLRRPFRLPRSKIDAEPLLLVSPELAVVPTPIIFRVRAGNSRPA
jgi:hypothetical protein